MIHNALVKIGAMERVIAIVANVAQTLADVGLRQLFNSINNKQRIIFGFQREGDIAFIH